MMTNKLRPLLVCLFALGSVQMMADGLYTPCFISRVTVRYSLPDDIKGKTVPSPKQIVYPTFPGEIVQAGISFDATIEITVLSDGRVTDIRVVESSIAEFANHAVEAVKQWRFDPPWLGGKRVTTSVKIICVFKFESGWDLDEQKP